MRGLGIADAQAKGLTGHLPRSPAYSQHVTYPVVLVLN